MEPRGQGSTELASLPTIQANLQDYRSLLKSIWSSASGREFRPFMTIDEEIAALLVYEVISLHNKYGKVTRKKAIAS